jgi:hypothetical protein
MSTVLPPPGVNPVAVNKYIVYFHCPTVQVAMLELTCNKILGYELIVGVIRVGRRFFFTVRCGRFCLGSTRVELQRRGICLFFCYYSSTLKFFTVDVNKENGNFDICILSTL